MGKVPATWLLAEADIKTGHVYRSMRGPARSADRFVIHVYDKFNVQRTAIAKVVEFFPVKFHPRDVSVTFLGKARTVRMDNFLRWARKALT
jgi:hypothetical protein